MDMGQCSTSQRYLDRSLNGFVFLVVDGFIEDFLVAWLANLDEGNGRTAVHTHDDRRVSHVIAGIEILREAGRRSGHVDEMDETLSSTTRTESNDRRKTS
jgi:hypothetical protein